MGIADQKTDKLRLTIIYVNEQGSGIREHERVWLPDGRTGTIREVLSDGKALLVEFEVPEGPDRYDDEIVMAADVRRVTDPNDVAEP